MSVRGERTDRAVLRDFPEMLAPILEYEATGRNG